LAGVQTRDRFGVAAAFAPRDEDDISLTGINIVVLQNKELLYTVFL
jgi:hypothetical protein